MSKPVLYIVSASIDSAAVANEWLSWLHREHMAEVIACGAASAEVFRGEQDTSTPLLLEVHYRFESKARLEAYFTHHAPALRAKGLALFPSERGIRLNRRVLHQDTT